MTTRLLYSLAAIMTIGLSVYGQNVKGQFTADSVFIYKNFKQYGTTAALWRFHKVLDTSNAPKIKLSASDLTELIDILKTTSNGKLFQQKYAGELCYMVVYDKGQKKRFVLYPSLKFSFLDDLDGMKRRIINDAANRQRIYDIIKKNWL